MKRNDRILTTHTGSLPRPKALAEMLVAKDQGQAYDPAALTAAVRAAVLDIVRRQVETGIDIVDDGEMSKPGYSTYIADRLTGFSGHAPRKPPLDTAGYPEFNAAMVRMTGPQNLRRSTCTAAVSLRDRAPMEADIANLHEAADVSGADEMFMTSASPGLVTAFQPNNFYASHEDYLEAIATAMQPEYEAIYNAGFALQLDCPDLAMARHTGFQDLGEEEFLKRAAHHVAVLNHAVRNIPADRMRLHICWGNYEGPHDHDIPLAKVAPILLKAKPAALVIEAANPRHEHEWSLWRTQKLPDDKKLIAGVIDTSTNYVEHPELIAQRIERLAEIVGRERVIAGTDCGFGTFAGYGKIDPSIAFKKLAAMVEGAELATKRLWAKAKPQKKAATPSRRARPATRKKAAARERVKAKRGRR
ncbi:MAG TPA: cobalamin-independent methionine synthase II family protein [Stellaceae bacterium]|jgi:5-methyltetrahydropteroyltriglutamate--homocysteine methyltransferase|nr:cobalamin-independent methionine synthase II family protein [Stellaceae bacterium]